MEMDKRCLSLNGITKNERNSHQKYAQTNNFELDWYTSAVKTKTEWKFFGKKSSISPHFEFSLEHKAIYSRMLLFCADQILFARLAIPDLVFKRLYSIINARKRAPLICWVRRKVLEQTKCSNSVIMMKIYGNV